MLVDLPNFRGKKCLEVSYCAFIAADKLASAGQKLTQAEHSLTTRYMKDGEEAFVRLVLPFPWEKASGDRIHVHLIVASAKRFKKKPKPNSKLKEVFGLLDPLLGEDIQTRLGGMFRIPRSKVPPIISATRLAITVKDIQVSLTAGTYSIRGAPFEKISWEYPDEGPVTIALEARTHTTFDHSYLLNGLELVESAFKTLITGAKDGEHPESD